MLQCFVCFLTLCTSSPEKYKLIIIPATPKLLRKVIMFIYNLSQILYGMVVERKLVSLPQHLPSLSFVTFNAVFSAGSYNKLPLPSIIIERELVKPVSFNTVAQKLSKLFNRNSSLSLRLIRTSL